jgi:hypothetical protein
MMTERSSGKWLLLIHQIPPKPAYFRVKVWRRLQSIGALPLKNSVYIIPANENTLEDFQWILREIIEGGGEASICSASFVEGTSDERVETMFRAARDSDYLQIADEAKVLLDAPLSKASMTDEERTALESGLTRLRKRLSQSSKIDFFHAPGREAASKLLREIESRLDEARDRSDYDPKINRKGDVKEFLGRTWVTRRGVYVDRIACAWLIQRFIDSDASFRFVSERGYRLKTGELRFDMFEGEFTHQGDLCSFEVILDRFSLSDEALLEIGRIVHDIDLKDQKFRKPESAGVAAFFDGIIAARQSDEARIERGLALFDDLYEYFRRK